MYKKLNDIGLTPPCGWIYAPDFVGTTIKANSFKELCENVRAIYHINHRELPDDLDDRIQDYLCRMSPTGFSAGFVNKLVFTSRTLMSGTAALGALLRFQGGGFVDQQTADERALICSQCDYNVANPSCYTCKGFAVVINQVRRGRTSVLDNKLNVCGICGCFIKALIHVNRHVLKASTKKRDVGHYPDWCWKKTEIMEAHNE
jgi:hypothetical protein